MDSKFSLLTVREAGLYCPDGNFYVDPTGAVSRAVVTHAHSDHTRRGHESYYCTGPSEPLVRRRAIEDPEEQEIQSFSYGESFTLGGVEVSFHPAGHLLGSAQVRVSDGDETWVITGDFKRTPDPTCRNFEPVDCDVFVTEVTYGLPIYRWKPPDDVFDSIDDWYQKNRAEGQPSVIFGYSVGKAQRLLADLDAIVDQPVLVHGALMDYNEIYRDQGVSLAETQYATELSKDWDYGEDLIVAPPNAFQSNWMSRFNNPSTALASGWMQIRGIKRRRGYDKGFVLSDHADWPALLETVKDVSPEIVYSTHGDTDTFCRYLREEKGIEARDLDVLGPDNHE